MSNKLTSKLARRLSVSIAIVATLFLSGCYERTAEGPVATYRYAWWLAPTVLAVCAAAIPLGFFIWKGKATRQYDAAKVFGPLLIFTGPAMAFLNVPANYKHSVIVDDEHFETKLGLWFDPEPFNVRFDDLRELQLISVPGPRGEPSQTLRWITKQGSMIEMAASGDVVKHTVAEILERAKARGVTVVDQIHKRRSPRDFPGGASFPTKDPVTDRPKQRPEN